MKLYIFKNTFLLLMVIVAITSCDSVKPKEKEIETTKESETIVEITLAQFESEKMELGNVSSQTFVESVKTNGYIDVPPANRAKVSAIMGGYVKNAPLLIGDEVKKGQLLLTIENPDFIDIQQNYLETIEELTYLKSENDRQKILFDEKITSQKNYLKAESKYKSTLALANGLAQKIRLLNINLSNVKAGEITSTIGIYAPISGSVTAVFTNIGEFKDSSEVLLEICISVIYHNPVILAITSLSNIRSPKYLRLSL